MFDRSHQPHTGGARQFLRWGARANAGMKQRFRRVNIAYADHHMPIHDELLDGDAAGAALCIEILRTEQVGERFGA